MIYEFSRKYTHFFTIKSPNAKKNSYFCARLNMDEDAKTHHTMDLCHRM